MTPRELPEAPMAETAAASETLREVIFLELRSAWYKGATLPGQVPDPTPDAIAERAFAASADVILAAAKVAEQKRAAAGNVRSRDQQVAAIRQQLIAARKTGRNVKLGWATPEGFFDGAVDAVLAAVVTPEALPREASPEPAVIPDGMTVSENPANTTGAYVAEYSRMTSGAILYKIVLPDGDPLGIAYAEATADGHLTAQTFDGRALPSMPPAIRTALARYRDKIRAQSSPWLPDGSPNPYLMLDPVEAGKLLETLKAA